MSHSNEHHLSRPADPAREHLERAAPCGLSHLDRAVLCGEPLPTIARPGSRWARQHVEIMRSIATGAVARASGLLSEHVTEFGCDPVAVVALSRVAGGDLRCLSLDGDGCPAQSIRA